MGNKARNTAGKFAPKSEVPRKVRSVNLTDDAWLWLAATAEKAGMSRNDYLEALAESSPLMGTVSADSHPLMETVTTQLDPLMETVHADFHPVMETVVTQFNPLMGTARADVETSDANITEQPIGKDAPLIETVRHEIESLEQQIEEARADYSKLLESSGQIKASREKELAEVRSQLKRERADREEVEVELSDLRKKSALAVAEFPEPADLLNQLKGQRKKSRADLGDIEAVLEILST